MIFLTIFLWTFSIIISFINKQEKYSRWLVLTAFWGGCGGLSVFINESVRSFIQYNISKDLITNDLISLFFIIFSSLSHFLTPYCFLIFSLYYTKILSAKKVKFISFLLFIPVVIMYIIFPIYPLFTPNYRVLVLWVTPYIVSANTLFFVSYFREKTPLLKQQKLLTCILAIPVTSFALITNYILRVFNIQETWRYNLWIILIQFIAFIFFSAKYGILGVKLRFEKHQVDRTMKSISSGTSILNHTIKNEIIKIEICTENIINSVCASDSKTLDNLDIIKKSTQHMFSMLERIQHQMQEVVFIEETNNICELIQNSIISVTPLIKNNNIKIISKISNSFFMKCDSTHIQEIFHNILINAVESILKEGKIIITLSQNNKFATISIKDTGKGISKNDLPLILDPFYTTKKSTSNFGLGLTYCYTVMQKHGGNLEVQSEVEKGTTVYLHFPLNRLIENQTSYTTHQQIS